MEAMQVWRGHFEGLQGVDGEVRQEWEAQGPWPLREALRPCDGRRKERGVRPTSATRKAKFSRTPLAGKSVNYPCQTDALVVM